MSVEGQKKEEVPKALARHKTGMGECHFTLKQPGLRITVAFVSTENGAVYLFLPASGRIGVAREEGTGFRREIGNLLRDPNSTIEQERYWCIDVEQGHNWSGVRHSYPKSHWVFYNRYCFFFNPHGVPNLTLPALDQTFNFIVAFSVFTNTTQTDMLQLVDQLKVS